jgi:hypothetical protein
MFIVQVAAVSCAATQVPEIKLANQSLRKTGFCNAFQVELFFIEVFLASVHKSLRLCDLCKELAFGAAAQKGKSRFSYNSFALSMLCRQFLES